MTWSQSQLPWVFVLPPVERGAGICLWGRSWWMGWLALRGPREQQRPPGLTRNSLDPCGLPLTPPAHPAPASVTPSKRPWGLEGLSLWRPLEGSWGFPGGASGKEPARQCRRRRRRGFDPQIGKIPWRRAWQPTPVFLPGESCGQRSLAGYGPWGGRVGHDRSDLARKDPTSPCGELPRNPSLSPRS